MSDSEEGSSRQISAGMQPVPAFPTNGSGDPVPVLTVTRGLPASGKSTWARGQVEEARHSSGRLALVDRDSIRDMLGLTFGQDESLVTAIEMNTVRDALKSGADVIVHDTNLRAQYVRRFVDLAVETGSTFAVKDFTDVSVDECVRRDAGRLPASPGRLAGASVGADAIRRMHSRYLAGHTLPLPIPEPRAATTGKPYTPPPDAPHAVMVDIDGTVALHAGRDVYDETRVSEDLPNRPVILAVRAMHAAGYQVVFMSGRSEACRNDTADWLDQHVAIGPTPLFMRAAGDSRKDAVIKLELFDAHVRDVYRIVLVWDDRKQVVDMWRSLGLTVAQVAEGNF